MSVPPQIIRVKRKATEDSPISFLRFQDNKRHRGDDFVYQRQQEEAAFEKIPSHIQEPIIHTTKLDRAAIVPQTPPRISEASEGTLPKDGSTRSSPATEPRHFHMSRKDMMVEASPYSSLRKHGGISKKNSATALFVERRIKRLPSKKVEKMAGILTSTPNLQLSRPSTARSSSPEPAAERMDVDMAEHRKYKRPGLTKHQPKDSIQRAEPDLPPALLDRWNFNTDELAAQMNAYVFDQIGESLRKADEEKQQELKRQRAREQQREQQKSRAVGQPRFKPKVPAKRYHERHPESAEEPAGEQKADADVEMSDTDDSDYVIETYVRVPASAMEKQQVSSRNIGLLVFDEEPDLEFFYGDGSDSDDEFPEDDEDENAENYYTADYPDEDLASDDEFNQNSYAFRTGNASDLEEYDFDHDSDSDFDRAGTNDEGEGGFKSYVKRGFRTKHL